MPLLLLAARYGRKNWADQSQAGRKRAAPQAKWIDDLCQRHGLRDMLAEHVRTEKKRPDGFLDCPVLASVEPGQQYDGTLTPFTDQEEFLFQQFGESVDCYSLTVKKFVLLRPPLSMDCPLRLKIPCWKPKQGIESADCLRRCSLSFEETASALGIQVAELRNFLEDPWCLQVPGVTLQLLMKGAWGSLMLRAAWLAPRSEGFARAEAFRKQVGWPPTEWFERQQKLRAAPRQEMPEVEALPFTGEHAKQVAVFLKSLAPTVLQCCERDTPELVVSMQMAFEEHVMRLEGAAKLAAAQSAGQGQKTWKFTSHQMLQALCGAMHFRDRSKLGDALKLTVGSVSKLQSDMIGDSKPPSAASISRSQVLVDSALCCLWAEAFMNFDGCLYLWADASPQGGVDWLLSLVRQIDGAVLGDCVEASNQLQESVHEFQQAFDANDLARMQEIVVTRHRLGLFLQTHLKTHCQIPMGLGSGEASLDRKLTCIARKFFAEAQSCWAWCEECAPI